MLAISSLTLAGMVKNVSSLEGSSYPSAEDRLFHRKNSEDSFILTFFPRVTSCVIIAQLLKQRNRDWYSTVIKSRVFPHIPLLSSLICLFWSNIPSITQLHILCLPSNCCFLKSFIQYGIDCPTALFFLILSHDWVEEKMFLRLPFPIIMRHQENKMAYAPLRWG